MEPAEREDLLLAVRRVEVRTGRQPTDTDLADLVHQSLQKVQDTLKHLVMADEILIKDGVISLTPSGEAAAAGVMKKHKVLETFFEEMLGMDRAVAHEQACTLEHHASEETISRLNDLIGLKPPCFRGRFFRKEHDKLSCGCRILADCGEGERVYISAVKGCGRSARLADLGIIPGEEITVRRRMAKTILIQVKGTDVAISTDIAKSVLVVSC
ncbi:MAG: metal-dependent transcriptional regulator [Methanobacteriota archaeon]